MIKFTLKYIYLFFAFCIPITQVISGYYTNHNLKKISLFNHYNDHSFKTNTNEDDRLKIRLNFNSVGVINRQLLLTVDDNCSDGYDWGYDGYLNDEQIDDMSWVINDGFFVIQGIGNIDNNTNLPLHIEKSAIGDVVISIHSLENVPDNLEIFLYDTFHDISYDLRNEDYQGLLESGSYNNRFQIKFNVINDLSISGVNLEEVLTVCYDKQLNRLKLYNPEKFNISEIGVYNLAGQLAYRQCKIGSKEEKILNINNLSKDIYIVKIITDDNRTIIKKLLIG